MSALSQKQESYTYEAQPQMTTSPSQDEVFNQHNNPFLKAQVLVCAVAFVWVMVMLVWTVASSVGVVNAQVQYQSAQSSASSISSKNATLQQEISELSSRSNLKKVASKANMKLNSKNVRNVTK